MFGIGTVCSDASVISEIGGDLWGTKMLRNHAQEIKIRLRLPRCLEIHTYRTGRELVDRDRYVVFQGSFRWLLQELTISCGHLRGSSSIT